MRRVSRLALLVILAAFFSLNHAEISQETGSLIGVEAYMKELRDPDPIIRRQAATGLGLMKCIPAVSGIIELLGDRETSKAAAAALRTINDPRGLAAIEEYKKKVDRCNQPLLEEEIPESLESDSKQDSPGMPIALLSKNEKNEKQEQLWWQYRNSSEPSKKVWLMRQLGRMEDNRIFEELGSDDYEIQRSIFKSLKYFHSQDVVNAMLSALKRFPRAKMVYSRKYSNLTDPALAATLIPLLAENDETIFSFAVNSLMNMGEAAALNTLQILLRDDDLKAYSPMREYEWQRALQSVDIRPKKDLLVDMSSTDPARRYLACTQLAGSRVVEAIVPMLHSIFDSHPRVRKQAIKAIRTWKNLRAYNYSIPAPGFNVNSFNDDFDPEFYAQFDEEMNAARRSPKLKEILRASDDDFNKGIEAMELLGLLGDDRASEIGRKLLIQAGTNNDKISTLAETMMKDGNATLNHAIFKRLSQNLSSFTKKNKNHYWTIFSLMEMTKDSSLIPGWVNLMTKACSVTLNNEDLSDSRETLIHATLNTLLKLGGKQALAFVSDIYMKGEEQNQELARQVLLKIDYKNTKSRLMNGINKDNYMLLSDLAEAAARERDRELALFLALQAPSASLILQLADSLPDEFLNRQTTMEVIGKDIGTLFYSTYDESVAHFFPRLKQDFRWFLCEKAIMAESSEDMPPWLRDELIHGGHPGSVALIVKALGDPELKAERKISLINIAGEDCSEDVIPALAALLKDRSARLNECAARALAKIGNQAAIQALASALTSESLLSREYATDALLSLEGGAVDIANIVESQGDEALNRWHEIKLIRQKSANLKLGQANAPPANEKSDQLARLAVVIANGIEKLEFTTKTKGYLTTKQRGAAGLCHLASSGEYIFAANANRLFILDNALNKKSECAVPDIGALQAASNTILVAAQGHLLVFDNELNLIGKAGLKIPTDEGEWKNAHDIMAKGASTYLIDDVSYPYYVVRMDINHPAQPKMLSKIKIDDVNQHLSMQFTSEEEGTWNVIQDQFHMGGKFQNLIQFSLADGQMIRRLEREMESPGQEDPEFLAVTDSMPGWAVAAYGRHIALVRMGKTTTWANPVPTLYLGMERDLTDEEMSGWFGDIPAAICQHGELLYVTANRHLWVVRAGEKPEIVLHQVLDKPVLKLTVLSD